MHPEPTFDNTDFDAADFAPVPSAPKLKVSRDGRVVGSRGHLLRLQSIYGYHAVNVSNGRGGNRTVMVHRLVAEVYLPAPTFEGACLDHRDGNRKNNNVDNLRWLTNAENLRNNARVREGGQYVGAYRIGNRYRAQYQDGFKSVHLGTFATAEEAAIRHDLERIARGLPPVNGLVPA